MILKHFTENNKEKQTLLRSNIFRRQGEAHMSTEFHKFKIHKRVGRNILDSE